jgi:hypothetical protein
MRALTSMHDVTSAGASNPCLKYVRPQHLPDRSIAIESTHEAHCCSSPLASNSRTSPTCAEEEEQGDGERGKLE